MMMKMASAVCFCILSALCAATSAFPSTQQRIYPQHQQINPLNYYLDSQDYYGADQKQGENHVSDGAPSRLETMGPDSEVELVPGVQPPQQPPQQPPVAPNLPGLLPGQRVFIVHMPIPGYRPGTIGGYQPVYIVAAGPQGNPGFPGSGFQNAILFDPSGQAVAPVLGYQKAAVLAPQHNPGVILGGPLALTRPLDLSYQDYANTGEPILQAVDDIRTIQLAQQVGLQGPGPQGHAAPISPAQHVDAVGSHKEGESEALLSPRDTQGIKETNAPKTKLRTPASNRKS